MPKFVVRFKVKPRRVSRDGQTVFEKGKVKAFTVSAKNARDAGNKLHSDGRILSIRKKK